MPSMLGRSSANWDGSRPRRSTRASARRSAGTSNTPSGCSACRAACIASGLRRSTPRRPERVKILLFGRNGQVGWELQRSLAPLGQVVALDSKGEAGLVGDFTDLAGLARTVAE